MKVYVDEQECTDVLDGADAASILDEVKTRASREGRVVTEIRVDNVAMDEDAFLNVTGGVSAHFSSQPVRELVRDSLDEALSYVPRLSKGLEEIALHFEAGELAAGQGKLADAADGLDWILLVFQNCSALLAVGEEAGGPALDELKEALCSSINLLGVLHEEKKYLQMALCIRQRLIPEVTKFSVYVQKLRDLTVSVQ